MPISRAMPVLKIAGRETVAIVDISRRSTVRTATIKTTAD